MLIAIPEHLTNPMKLFRLGLDSLPQGYIDWHKQIAEARIKEDFKGYTIHHQYMADDGWCDGMQFLNLIVERNGTLYKVKWSDGQNWFMQVPGGWGWVLFDPAKPKVMEIKH